MSAWGAAELPDGADVHTFFDQPGLLPGFADANRPRAIAAGIDPFQYDAVTAELTSIRDWPTAFARAGREHLARAEQADEQGLSASASEAYRDAALWFHFATVLPNPDLDVHAAAAKASADAQRRADPAAEHITDPDFAGILRRPTGIRAPVVVLIPGMNSGKVEFMSIADSLLRRGVAVLAIDGPGQGELATRSHWEPEYQKVVHRVLDVIADRSDVDGQRVAAMALSMGGYLGALAAAHEPRIRALVSVSGPSALHWDRLAPYVTDTFALRTGSVAAGRDFARRINAAEIAPRIAQPMRVLDGGLDVIPGVANAEPLARHAPNAEYLLIPEGNHLLETTRWKWLPDTADWLADHLRK
ncbi:alpha/beta fold hydrolase [Saccharopolyspora shandongensis]|uniref:alpha/beta hydrolase family protein n=1 Tax=Saccharopolyspora shandongensis TaxID=418495 RepID=UPI0034464326